MGGILAAFVGAASSVILDPFARGDLSVADLDAGRAALAGGLTMTYWLMAAAAVAAWIVAVRAMPDVRLGHQLADPRTVGEAPAA